MESQVSESNSVIEIDIPNPQSQIQKYNELSTKVNKLHASFLFHRDKIHTDEIPQLCKNIYISLVKRIGGTKETVFSSGWKDLGYHLGISGEEINYIENSMLHCPTDTVLKVFCQDENATFEKIIQALISIKRLDVIEGIFEPLNKLHENLSTCENNEDNGYNSNTDENSITDTIRPTYFAVNLPEVLRHNKTKEDDNLSTTDISKDLCDITTLMPCIEKPSVLLTYAEDGIQISQRIYNFLDQYFSKGKKIHVVSLEAMRQSILMNPELYIRHFFEETNYVIPILTEGYIKLIRSPESIYRSVLDNIDCTYARFIYTLMSTHYINGTGCLNSKVRCILPKYGNRKVLEELYKFPILSVWIREEQLEKFLHTIF